MNVAIITKYRPATDKRGSRIVAKACGGLQVSIPYPHELSGEDVHALAAEALMKKANWAGALSSVAMLPEGGYVFIVS